MELKKLAQGIKSTGASENKTRTIRVESQVHSSLHRRIARTRTKYIGLSTVTEYL